uniref:Uncharacterized protein n=1 Tax=Arundo donax TaxID=35708 RepID=A0A0A8YXC8_ARUDO
MCALLTFRKNGTNHRVFRRAVYSSV